MNWLEHLSEKRCGRKSTLSDPDAFAEGVGAWGYKKGDFPVSEAHTLFGIHVAGPSAYD